MRSIHAIARATAVSVLFCTTAHAGVMRFESHVSEPQNVPTDRPEVNPDAHKIVTILGQKDPRIEVWFVVHYSTTNEACRARTISQLLSGAPEIPQTISDYFRVPAGQTTFSVRVFLDQYAEGRCGWSPFGIGRAEFLPEDSSGPGAIGGLAIIRNDGSDHFWAQYDCRRRVAPRNVDPHFYLGCVPTLSTARARGAIATEGGAVVVQMRLDTPTEQQTPDEVAHPMHGGI